MNPQTAALTARSLNAEEAAAIAVEAYVYLYPLITMETTRRQTTSLPAGERIGFGPMGRFTHVREFPSADFRAVVRANFDTLYSSAWLDLTVEPSVITVPDTGGRYYLLPMYDMWTDAFAAPGTRTTGTQAGEFAVIPPGWNGSLPDGVQPIAAATRYVWIIGRTQTDGPSDYEAVHAVQDGLGVTPLSRHGQDWSAPEPTPDPHADPDTPPLEQVNALAAQEYFSAGAHLMAIHPPHVTDWSILARLARLGLRPGREFELDGLDGAVRDAVTEAPERALALIRAAQSRVARVTNGWLMNTDSIGVYGNFYLKRALVAMAGLGANQPEDAIYPLNITDADGRPMTGEHDYVLHFNADELPPVSAFWSVTMYDADGFQAANQLDRFALGDRDELRYNDDGSLDIYLQHDNPGPGGESNWLPAPTGALGVTMRLYAPEPEALDGRWNPPAIRRVDQH